MAFSCPCVVEIKPQKIKVFFGSFILVDGENACFILRHLQAELCKPFFQELQHHPGFFFHLKQDDKIIGIPDVVHLSDHHFLDFQRHPKIENVMQIHVGENRRYQTAVKRQEN